MKNNSLDEIIKCNVDISSAVSNDVTADRILLVVPAPEAEGELQLDSVKAISKVEELLDYGYTEEDTAYIAAQVAFSQSPAPASLLICTRKGTDGGYEDITSTLNKANEEAEFYGVHITEFKDSNDVINTIKWVEKNEKLFAFEYTDYDEFPVADSTTKYYRSLGLFAGNTDVESELNEYAALGWMAEMFGYEAGTETWHLKEIKGIEPSRLTDAQKTELKAKNINTFLRYAGVNCTIGGLTLAGEWIDVIRFRDWLKNEMQKKIFKALKANRKVPFTDNGIGMIEGAMEEVLKTGQDLGGIVADKYDDDNNIISGYEVYVPKASDISEEEKKSRKLSGCRYTAKLASAIHLVEIEGYLTF